MDTELVVRAQGGDLQAFEGLAAQSHARLFRVALGILRDADRAEDATQLALVEIWKDGTLWATLVPDRLEPDPSEPVVLVRYDGQDWAAVSVPDHIAAAFTRLPSRLSTDPVTDDLVIGSRPDRPSIRYDGVEFSLEQVPENGMGDVVASSDGTLWGTSRPYNRGLLMLPTVEPTVIEEASRSPLPHTPRR